MKKLPKTIFVYRDAFDDGSGEFFVAHDNLTDTAPEKIGESRLVGVYELRDIQHLSLELVKTPD